MDPAAVGLAWLPSISNGGEVIYVCLRDPSSLWPRGSGLGKMQFERSLLQAVLPTDSVWGFCDRGGLRGLVKVVGSESPDPLINYPPPQHTMPASLSDIGRQAIA